MVFFILIIKVHNSERIINIESFYLKYQLLAIASFQSKGRANLLFLHSGTCS